MEYGTAISPTVASMRHEKDLGIMIQAADVAMSKRNVAVIQGQHGEANRPVEWNKIGLYFKLAVRDDAEKKIKSNKMRKEGEQVDHIFEVRYFAAVFLHTIAEVIATGEEFYPEVADIAFAVNIVNHAENLRSMKPQDHKFKTKYFTPGNKQPEYSAALLTYLMSATPKFKNAVEEILKTVGQKEHHGAFKVKLIKNLLSTPWCTENQWGSILQGSEPFSKNITLADYVPNDFIDDNEFFAH